MLYVVYVTRRNLPAIEARLPIKMSLGKMSQRGKKSDRAKKEIEEGTARRKIPGDPAFSGAIVCQVGNKQLASFNRSCLLACLLAHSFVVPRMMASILLL